VSYYKDLGRIGRDLSRTIIIDDTPHNFRYNKENGLCVKTWTDDPYDTQLLGLLGLLKRIAALNVPDVRHIVKRINTELGEDLISNHSNPYEIINI
jgi:CTD small phosphatase-like protein 2